MLKSTLAAVAAVFALSAVSPAALAAKGDPHVLLTTSAGDGCRFRYFSVLPGHGGKGRSACAADHFGR